MADLEKSVAIVFEGVDKMGSGVDSATKKMRGVTDAAQGITGPISGATQKILKFEGALIASGTAAAGLAVKLAGDFDAQFREISTLIDEPTEDIAAFKEEVKAYGSESTKSLEDVNTSVYNAISAGVDYTESLDAVREAEKLAVAGQSDLDQSLTTLVSSLNAYGTGMDDAEHFSDLLFQTVRSGQTTLPELGNSLSKVTGLAATAGVDFEDLMAAIGTLTATGSSTSEAVTQIRGAISNIIKPTAKATEKAKDLGVKFDAAALESRGLSGVLKDVQKATGGSTEEMGQLFGNVEALNGVLTLTGTGADKFAETLVDMDNAAGATEEAFEKMTGTVEDGGQQIQNALKGMLIEIGEPLLDEVGGIQSAIADIFNSIGASISDGELEQFVDQIEGVAQELEETLADVAKNLPEALESADFSGFIGGFDAVKDAVSGLFDDADLTTAEGLTSVIETLGAGVESLGEFTAGTIEQLGPFIQKLADAAEWVVKLDPEMVKLAGSIGGIGIAANNVLGGIGGFLTIVQTLAGSGGAPPIATKALRGLGKVFARFAGPTGWAILAYESIVHFKDGLDKINDLRWELDPSLQTDLDEIKKSQQEATEFGKQMVATLSDSYGELSDLFGWDDDAVAAFDTLSQAAQESALVVANSASKMGDEGSEEVEKLTQTAKNMATLIGGVRDDFESSMQEVDAPLVDQFGELPDSLSKVTDILSQSGDDVEATAKEVGKSLSKLQQAFDAGEIDQAQYDTLKTKLLNVRDASEEAAGGQGELADKALKGEEAILKARKAVQEQELALEEIASNERIKGMEFAVDVKTAKLEADAKKVESILNATSETISSTGDAAASIFGNLGDLGIGDKVQARGAIDQQLDIQRDAAKQQGRLIDAQVKSLNEKTRAMKNGEGLVKIESDGLEPALETIMWEILEKIQMRANAEGAEFLLGL